MLLYFAVDLMFLNLAGTRLRKMHYYPITELSTVPWGAKLSPPLNIKDRGKNTKKDPLWTWINLFTSTGTKFSTAVVP